MAREVVKKRIGPDGIEIACDADPEKWVDIKETTKQRFERGRGKHYQATVYQFAERSERREYDEEPKSTFTNPVNESQTIEYLSEKGPNHGVINKLVLEAGRGKHYRKTILEYANSEDNVTRRTRTQVVTNEDTGDTIDVERITRFTVKTGRGKHYQQKRVIPRNEEEVIEASTGPCKVEG